MSRAKRTPRELLAKLVAAGFDRSTTEGRSCYPRCSQCAAVVVQGVACHEHGCPNTAAVALPHHDLDAEVSGWGEPVPW